MRIALVIERMDLARGGRETSTAQIAEGLARRGHQATIICREGAWQGQGVHVRRLGARGRLRIQRLRNFIADAARACRQGGFDVVHSMLPLPGSDVYQPRGGTVPAQQDASSRRRGSMGKFIVALAEPLNFCRRELAKLERRVVREGKTLCLAPSRMIAEEFRNYYGQAGGARVVFNAVDVPEADGPQRAEWRRRRRFDLGVHQDDLVFLTVATNYALKGVREAIEAFSTWYHHRDSRMGARLVVLGGQKTRPYRRLAGRLGVDSQVVFPPPTGEMFPWYAAADAVVLLSWYDPCSRVVLEATRWGIPSITTVYNGAAEALEAGGGIVVSAPRDISAVAAAMNELSKPEVRAVRSQACREAADLLSTDRHVDELLAAYADVLAARQAGAQAGPARQDGSRSGPAAGAARG